MRRRDVLAGAAAVIAASSAQAKAEAQAQAGVVRVDLQTGEGVIALALAADKAPLTVASFLRYVDARLYDGATIYRALRAPGAPQFGLIQGGARSSLAPIAHESTTQTGLRHVDGTISLARRAPGSATSDFFICIGDAAYLDADPKAPGDNLGFAAFGQVVEGMDVVRRILALPTSPTKGAPDMAGQMLEPPVPISSARRVG